MRARETRPCDRCVRAQRRSSCVLFEPMFVQLDVERVAGGSAVLAPQLPLGKTDAVERYSRSVAAAQCELFGIQKGAADPFDRAALTENVVRGAHVRRPLVVRD